MQKYARILPVVLTVLMLLLLMNSGLGAQLPKDSVSVARDLQPAYHLDSNSETIVQAGYRVPITLTQSNSFTNGGSLPCLNPEATHFWRAFDLQAVGISTDLTVQSVDVGIDLVSTTANLVVKVYSSTQNPPKLASLTLLGSGQISITAQNAATLVNVPVAAVLPAGSIMVVEAVQPIGDPFNAGFNTLGQTAPTYVSGCNIGEITDLANFAPNSGWVMRVNGDDGVPTATPTLTDTPTDVPTATPTDTPTDVPTATATEIPQTELVVNGGFEAETLDPWVVKNETGDKVKCNTETKTVSNSGLCAFQFKGVTGESSKIQQMLVLNGVTFTATDVLDLSVFVNAKKATASGKVKVVVTYSDSPDSTKLTGNIVATVGYVELTDSDTLLSAAVSGIKLQIKHTSVSGKVYLDDVSLVLTAGNPALVPLP